MNSFSESLVVLDGRVDDEKLAGLLEIQTELPELDFKQLIGAGRGFLALHSSS